MSAEILIVDDDTDTRELLQEILHLRGYRPTVCANGDEALTHLRTSRPPSLILLDLHMPVMTGYEFRAAQREDRALARVPVIVMTSDKEIDQEALGGVQVIPKPFRADQLLTAIQRVSSPT
jgi:CheY-like chemotaxis protein